MTDKQEAQHGRPMKRGRERNTLWAMLALAACVASPMAGADGVILRTADWRTPIDLIACMPGDTRSLGSDSATVIVKGPRIVDNDDECILTFALRTPDGNAVYECAFRAP